jgi:hypothetical protein
MGGQEVRVPEQSENIIKKARFHQPRGERPKRLPVSDRTTAI